MPFVDQEYRDNPDMEIPGDRCYLLYKELLDEWENSPRWTTVDTMLNDFLNNVDQGKVPKRHRAAAILAFMVFFQLHVIPYELKKREENGDI